MAEVNDFLRKRYFMLFGEDAQKVIKSEFEPLKPAIRVNTLRISPNVIKKRLIRKGFKLRKIPWLDYGFWIDYAPYSPGCTTEYLLGYYYIQSPAAMLPPIVLNPKKDDVVLDMCAAPGGKATHLAQLMENEGIIVAIDVNEQRLQALKANVCRLGIKNIIALHMDARDVKELDLEFDKILLDAPCSGSIKKDISRAFNYSEKDIKNCVKVQKDLIKAAYDVLKDNGILVYSTCTLAPEENEEIIIYAVEKLGFSLENIAINGLCEGFTKFGDKVYPDYVRKCKRLLPHIHETEPFFIAKLKKAH